MSEALMLQPGIAGDVSVHLNSHLRCIPRGILNEKALGWACLDTKQILSTTKTTAFPYKYATRKCGVQAAADFGEVSSNGRTETDFSIKKKKVKTKKHANFDSAQQLHTLGSALEEELSNVNQNRPKDNTKPYNAELGSARNSNKTVQKSVWKQQEVKSPELSSAEGEQNLLACLLNKLEALCLHASALEQWNAPRLFDIHRKYQASARNLLHYVAFRSVDIHDLQEMLPSLGLANLEGIEAHTVASLTLVIRAVRALLKVHVPDSVMISDELVENRSQMDLMGILPESILHGPALGLKSSNEEIPSDLTVGTSKAALRQNTEALLGPRSCGRRTDIMVTLSGEAVENETLVLDLMKAGMNVVRINCAHGNTDVWREIIRTVKSCSQMLEQPCRVLMDLAGPKLRTSPLPPGPCVQKIKPHRDGCGKVTAPAQVWIALADVPVPAGQSPDAVIPVTGKNWIQTLQVGDVLKFKDARGRRQKLNITDKIVGSAGVGYWAECYNTAYLESGTELELLKLKGRLDKGHVSVLPCFEHSVRVKKGDLLVITREPCLTTSDKTDHSRSHIVPIRIACSFGQLFDSVKPGEPIKFDDGRIEGIIRGVTLSEICVEVTFASEKGTKLGGEKSINVPESNLCFKGLTVKDLIDLDFVVGHADMVGLSFVNDEKDVQILQNALGKRDADHIGIVLKIETRSGLEKLPQILLQGMQTGNPLGVMIARGDLAVECGWESLAEMQDQLMQICEAAHVPTIWATQVLEGLTKEGLPTRPEITDAAVGGRAECVMLNKGLHIVKAVSTLDSILKRISVQQNKVHTNLRPLQMLSPFQ